MAFLISFYAMILRVLAGRRSPRSKSIETGPRILCLTRGELKDLLDALPIFYTLRRHFPKAQLTVVCDKCTSPIALACAPVNDVIALDADWTPWLAAFKNAAKLHDHDWVIAISGAFDRPLARLTRFTNAAVRVGFEAYTGRRSLYYTDPVEPLPEPNEEHISDAHLRLLKPLGLVKPTNLAAKPSLRVPDSSREFASEILAQPPFDLSPQFMLINLSIKAGIKFREEDFIALAGRVLGSTDFVIGLVSPLADQQKAHEIALCMGSKRIFALDTPPPLDLAALLERALLLFTPEGEAAHLAAAVGTPALVLWSAGPFQKNHSRGRRHLFVHAESGETTIPVERVWQALQPLLILKKADLEKQWNEMLELPPTSDFM
jgi:ADP-heptose:LPS heptosyltransferase